MANTLHMKGIVKDGQLSNHFKGPMRSNQVMVMKFGIMVTIPGIIMLLSKMPKIKFRPGKLIRAKA